jgi:hypothetical protein
MTGIYPFHHSDPKKNVDKYWKYKNPDPSTALYTSGIVAELFITIEEKIAQDVKRLYHLRPQSILGTDLKHSVIRELSYRLNKEVLKIEHFEKENSGDIRNFTDSVEQVV